MIGKGLWLKPFVGRGPCKVLLATILWRTVGHMTSVRYAYFLIDTHSPPEPSSADILAARLRLLISTTLSSLRLSTSDNGDLVPVKWSFRLFDSRVGHQIGRKQSTLPTISSLSAESLNELSVAVTQAFPKTSSTTAGKSTSTTSSTLKKLPELTPKLKRRPSPKFEVSTSQNSSFFENVAIAVSLAHGDIMQAATPLSEHDGDQTTANKNPQEPRNSARSRKHESLLFIVSPYPETFHELMRAIEKPEEQLQSLTKPPLGRPAALLYSKMKLKPILESLSKPSQQIKRGDTSCQTIWLDTKSWVILPPSQLASSDAELMLSFFGPWHRLKASDETNDYESERSQTLEMASENGLAVVSSCAVSSLALASWPSCAVKQISTLLTAGWAPKAPAELLVDGNTLNLTLDMASASVTEDAAALLESISQLVVACKLPYVDVLRCAWSHMWLASSSNWQSLLQQLSDSSQALLLLPSKKGFKKVFFLVPISEHLAQIVEIDLRNTMQSFLTSSDQVSSNLLAFPSLTQAPSTFLKRADSRHQASLPRQSSVEVATQLLSASHHLDELNESPTIGDLVLQLEDDANTSQHAEGHLKGSIHSPPASRPTLSRSSGITLAEDSNQGIVIGSMNDTLTRFDPESPERLAAVFALYFTDLYTRILHSLSVFEFPHLVPTHADGIMELLNSLPAVELVWKPQHVYLNCNDHRSLERALSQSFEDIYQACTHIPYAYSVLASVLESKFLVAETLLSAKYLGETVQLAVEVSSCDSQVPESALLSAEKKLIEHRMQVFLRLAAWKYHSKSTVGETKGSKKLEMDASNRKQLFSLLESIAFLYSTKAETEAFREYFEALSSTSGIPNTMRWLKKRLGVEDGASFLPSLTLENSNDSHSAERNAHATTVAQDVFTSSFLDSLLESTSLTSSETIPIDGRNSPSSAFALLIAQPTLQTQPNLETRLPQDDELEPRKRSSKRSAEEAIAPINSKRSIATEL